METIRRFNLSRACDLAIFDPGANVKPKSVTLYGNGNVGGQPEAPESRDSFGTRDTEDAAPERGRPYGATLSPLRR